MKKIILFFIVLVAIFATTAKANCFSPTSASFTTTTNTDSVSIYPVPNNGSFNIWVTSENEKTFSITIYNMISREACKGKDLATNERVAFDLRNAPSGLYYCEIVCGNKTFHKKIVIN